MEDFIVVTHISSIKNKLIYFLIKECIFTYEEKKYV